MEAELQVELTEWFPFFLVCSIVMAFNATEFLFHTMSKDNIVVVKDNKE